MHRAKRYAPSRRSPWCPAFPFVGMVPGVKLSSACAWVSMTGFWVAISNGASPSEPLGQNRHLTLQGGRCFGGICPMGGNLVVPAATVAYDSFADSLCRKSRFIDLLVDP